MPRAAGNSRNYGVSVIDGDGNAVGQRYEFPSVTTILGETLNKGGAMMGWAYNTAIEGVRALIDKGIDLRPLDEDQLKAWLKDEGFSPWRKRDSAADRGTTAHDVLEAALTDFDAGAAKLEAVEDPEHRPFAQAALKWVADVEPVAELIEHPLVSFRHWFAGTLDFFGQIEGRNILGDAKTSKRIYDSHGIQLSAYRLALEEHGYHVDGTAVIRLADDGTYEYQEVDSDPEIFLALRQLYRLLKGV